MLASRVVSLGPEIPEGSTRQDSFHETNIHCDINIFKGIPDLGYGVCVCIAVSYNAMSEIVAVVQSAIFSTPDASNGV